MSDSFIKRIFQFRKVNYVKVGSFENDCLKDMLVILEPNSEEITVESGEHFDLLVPEGYEVLPLHIIYHEENALQVFPAAGAVAWKLRHRGELVDVDYIVRLKKPERKPVRVGKKKRI